MSVKHKQEPKNFGYKQKITILLREGVIFQKYVTLSASFTWENKTRSRRVFQLKVPDLIQLITEDRLRHASGPVQTLSPLRRY